MFRLTLLLCCALFLTLLIGGRDFGQARFGLRDQPAVVAKAAVPAAVSPVTVAVLPAVAEAAAPAVSLTPVVQPLPPEVTQASFSTAEPASDPAPERAVIPGIAELSGLAPTVVDGSVTAGGAEGTVRYVTAAAVNVRGGPSTAFDVVGRLTRGEAALVVLSDPNGWSLIRIEGDGIEGYVSSRYLAEALN